MDRKPLTGQYKWGLETGEFHIVADGEGEHTAGIGPRADSYPCDSCQGHGHFEVHHPNAWRI
jgi:hypothetical protein